MNLYLLVEGRQTERQIYRSWFSHIFPQLQQVDSIDELDDNHYYLITGNGYPSYLNRIKSSLQDIQSCSGRIQHFLIMIDSECMTYEEKKTEIANCIMRDAQEIGFDLSSVDVHIVVHHCCIETWLLGNTRFLRRSPSSADFAKWKRRYDVAQYDPEFLETPEEYWTRAQFHYEYLREMFRERNQAYTKNSPGVAKSAQDRRQADW